MQQNERLYPLSVAVEKATGRRPHLTTCLRWSTRGIAGIRLETKVLGGQRLASEEAVLRFVEQVTEAKESKLANTNPPCPVISPRTALRAAERLAREIAGSSNPPQDR